MYRVYVRELYNLEHNNLWRLGDSFREIEAKYVNVGWGGWLEYSTTNEDPVQTELETIGAGFWHSIDWTPDV